MMSSAKVLPYSSGEWLRAMAITYSLTLMCPSLCTILLSYFCSCSVRWVIPLSESNFCVSTIFTHCIWHTAHNLDGERIQPPWISSVLVFVKLNPQASGIYEIINGNQLGLTQKQFCFEIGLVSTSSPLTKELFAIDTYWKRQSQFYPMEWCWSYKPLPVDCQQRTRL